MVFLSRLARVSTTRSSRYRQRYGRGDAAQGGGLVVEEVWNMRRGNSTTCMALGLLGLGLVLGCGTEPTLPISVTVSPPRVSLITGGSQDFSA